VTDFRPLEIVHVDLAAGLPALAEGERDLHVVFWWQNVPLGQEDMTRAQLAARASLLHAAARRVAPAVGARLRVRGFVGEDPEIGLLAAGAPPELEELLAVERPLEGLARAAPDPAFEDLSVSVVVCTRDRPDDLERLLRSLGDLTVAAHEVVVVDNAPSSGVTGPVVARFPGVDYVAEPRPGLSAARNAGIRASTGELVAFVDDDVTVHPDWLWRLREGFDGERVLAVTGLVLPAELETRAQMVFEYGLGGFARGFRRLTYDRAFFAEQKARAVPVWKVGAGASMAFRRAAFDLVGEFDERLGAGASGCSEDSELWYRLLAEGFECCYEPAAVVFHHHRRDEQALKRQAHDYLRGHVAALFVQYARYRHLGNLHRALVALPPHLAKRGVKEAAKTVLDRLGLGPYPRRGTYLAEVSGYLRGLALAPFAWRESPQEGVPPRHKAPLGAFLRQNPFPYPYTEGFFYREKMRAIHAVAPDRALPRILEVGGGRSGLTSLLYPRAEVTNVDVDPEFAESPLNRRANVRFVEGDATDLAFPDESFDAVTMFDVLEHIPDDARAVSEAFRVLRPGGFLLVTSPNERWRFPFYRPLEAICPPEEEMIAAWGHVRRGYALAELQRLTGAAPSSAATFITPLTVLCHDLSFSRLPSRVRRALCVGLSPLTWAAYALHPQEGPGTETASSWQKREA
jgi:GT2 family glycosyltransferase